MEKKVGAVRGTLRGRNRPADRGLTSGALELGTPFRGRHPRSKAISDLFPSPPLRTLPTIFQRQKLPLSWVVAGKSGVGAFKKTPVVVGRLKIRA